MSSGIQKSIVDGLRYLATRVEEGYYGEGDEAFVEDLEVEAFEEDLEEYVTDLIL